MAQAVLGTITLTVVARMIGVRVSLAIAPAAGLAVVVLLTVLCVCGIAVTIAARARSFSEGALLTDGLGAGLVFLAPVYCTADALPRIVRIISTVLPTTYAARGVDAALAGTLPSAADVATLAVMAVIALGTGFRVMRWQQE